MFCFVFKQQQECSLDFDVDQVISQQPTFNAFALFIKFGMNHGPTKVSLAVSFIAITEKGHAH